MHLVTSLAFGGLERRMEILSKFPSLDNEIVFRALGTGGATQEAMIENGSDVVALGADVRIFRPRTLFSLIREIRKADPDLLHTHGCEANFYGALAGRIAGVKHIVGEEIGVSRLSFKSRVAFRLIFSLCDAVIAMSPVVSEHLARARLVKPSKLHLVYNPVLLSRVRRRPSAEKAYPLKFIYVGRLESIKNPLGLVAAFASMLSDGCDARLTIVGDGSLSKELSDYIASRELEDVVTLYGYSPNPLAQILEHHVAVQSSHTEGFSLSLVEAMSCGLPAVATPVGGATELIRHGWNGWLARSSSPEDMYEAMCAAYRDAERVSAMGQRAAESIEGEYDAARYSAKLDTFYRNEVIR